MPVSPPIEIVVSPLEVAALAVAFLADLPQLFFELSRTEFDADWQEGEGHA